MATETAVRIQEALTEAATAAGLAPSIHNTQPWHWRVRTGVLELWSAPARRLPATDPEGRMAAISCGAALHHARVALAALGFEVVVRRLPDPAQPELLAQLTVAGHQPVTAPAMRYYQAIALRRTDRRPVTGVPVEPDTLAQIADAARAEGTDLHVLRRDQVLELAAAASQAEQAEATDEVFRAELAYWAGGSRPSGAGVPDANIPSEPPATTVPGRDFGHPGSLEVSAEHDRAASYAILYAGTDDLAAWLRAGEALSAGWLVATELGVSVLPLSAVIEVTATRERLARMLVSGCHPQLVLRLGTADPEHRGPAPTPRLPGAQTIETLDG
ncbi:MAG TPA: nitroreductase [Rugosimonospora sp.]|nr:nitroreductase [Rugosimonospora sp.]